MSLSNEINNYWWKLWTLKYLRENFPNLRENILNCVLIKHGEDLSKKKVKELYWFWYGAIARWSHIDDWDWMVDAIPTKELKIPYVLFGKKKALVEILDKEYREPAARSHEYDVTQLTLWLSQYVNHELWTVTEHPNEKDRMYFDMCIRMNWLYRAEYELIWDTFHSLRDCSLSKTNERTALELVRKVRATNAFDENDRLQYEIWVGPFDHPYLFQVRKFSDKFDRYSKEILDLLKDKRRNSWTRIFWNFDYYWKKMRIVNEQDYDYPEKWELIFTGKTPFRIPSEIKDRVKVVAADKWILSHGLTWPAQTVLKNNWLVIAWTFISKEKYGRVGGSKYISLS